ncbi:Polygalacturonase-1 non-catalytic subunit beta like [Melia azedarach]|uniref:Polygalacturonase-1 non-catalytic subunit beta like n=1 Tax=Melia azedarach TaxID=155640 RepID=A0ACC1XIJ3_MELAZ|nr:Polygalacturonase-1 non-catalytic subunit beta like [Melia azedarach]
MRPMGSHISFVFLFFLSFLTATAKIAGAGEISGDLKAKENPFTPKAYLMRYWDKTIQNNLPKSAFLLSKASPLNAVDSANYAKLAAEKTLSAVLPSFCSSAKLFCFPDLSPSLEKHDADSNFATYLNKNFTDYGTGGPGGVNSFKSYSNNDNVVVDSFRRYSRDSAGHDDKFSTYASGSNVVDQTFNSYGTGATGGTGDFKNYNPNVNVPNLGFISYSDDGNARAQSFTTYNEQTNSGSQSFTSYGKNGNGEPNEFVTYGKDTNVVESNFAAYGESGNVADNTFKSYGTQGNNPQENFRSYGDGDNSGVESFSSYNSDSNVGGDTFKSYAKNSNSEKVTFTTYSDGANGVTHQFSNYGKSADGQKIGFKTYGPNRSFKDYAKHGVTFDSYSKNSSSAKTSGNLVNKWVVEPGKFFRESMLKKGIVMPMPDITDKMPKRSFLPRNVVSKLPFTSSKANEVKEIFHASENSTMERIIKDALSECERAPSMGETKRCVGSAEDMIDFATSVLGNNVALRTTENVKGSKQNILIGSIKGINSGKVTKSVSCHQSLYPYLLYYCHSVPKVRVYEADILDPKTKAKINHGVAICHLDTSAWSPTHGAFLALGSGPGRIEVCHWIFENDLTWTIADRSG